VGAAILLLGGRRTDGWGHWLAVALPVAAFAWAVLVLVELLGMGAGERSVSVPVYEWFAVGDFSAQVNLLVDPLSISFVLLITFVGSLIHVYSIGYMSHDPGRRRFFAYLNLFVAAMLVLVLADNFALLFLGWEGVGLASYLLIGFWQYKPSAAAAAKKAFIINRVGDMGLLAAIMIMFTALGAVSFSDVFAAVPGAGNGVLVAIGVLRAIVHWNRDEDGQGIERIVLAIVHGVEDITYRWLPGLINLIGDLLSGLLGS
jgi:NADH-quinone oxidoreductase subunit L